MLVTETKLIFKNILCLLKNDKIIKYISFYKVFEKRGKNDTGL